GHGVEDRLRVTGVEDAAVVEGAEVDVVLRPRRDRRVLDVTVGQRLILVFPPGEGGLRVGYELVGRRLLGRRRTARGRAVHVLFGRRGRTAVIVIDSRRAAV